MHKLRLFEVRVRGKTSSDPVADMIAAMRLQLRWDRRAWFWLLSKLSNFLQRYEGYFTRHTYLSDAEKGDPVAQCRLGHACFRSALKTGDYTEAVHWFEKAAAQNYAEAAWRLGHLYLKGNGVARDPAEAKRLLRKAAEQGNPFYQYDYAAMCGNRDFGLRDADEFDRWMLKAAEQGDPEAQMALGRDCERNGRDLVQAYMWYTLAALHHASAHTSKDPYTPKNAREARDRLGRDMSPEAIKEAETRVQSWLNQHAAVMGENMAADWRANVAEPFTKKQRAEMREIGRRMKRKKLF